MNQTGILCTRYTHGATLCSTYTPLPGPGVRNELRRGGGHSADKHVWLACSHVGVSEQRRGSCERAVHFGPSDQACELEVYDNL